MSFYSPLVLIALVAIPLLVVLYLLRQRGRGRDRDAFVSGALAVSVIRERPGWRRHAPMLAFLLALAVLIVAAARPRTTEAVTVKHAAIMLATDHSGSMAATDVAPSRLVAVKRAADAFLAKVPDQISVGVMAFNQTPTVLTPPTTDRATDRSALVNVQPHGGTAIGDAIQTAVHLLTSVPQSSRPPAAIVLLSDGSSTSGVNAVTAARAAARQHIRIYTVALGTANGTITAKTGKGSATVKRSVPPDPQALAQIAHASGGQAYTAQDAQDLSAVYKHLGAQLSHRKQTRELTAGFAGGGLVLLLLGSALSLLWFGRLI
jgi:Ca-activated chloride channel family protein